MQIVNFGGNVKFTPKHIYQPKTEQDVLEILEKHKNGKIKVKSSLHSWSKITQTSGILIDLANFNKVEIFQESGQAWAQVGGGCILADMLDYINNHTNYAVPTLGGIKRQTIAGVISTGTHGSGNHSLSHFMQEISLAAFDPKTKRAKIYQIDKGEDLLSARCSLGMMGIILSVKFKLLPKFWIKESLARFKNLESILSQRAKFPLQLFALFPYIWTYSVFQREIITKPPTSLQILTSFIHRIWDFLNIEIISHLINLALIRLFNGEKGQVKPVIYFYKNVVANLIHQPQVINRYDDGLTLHTSHHYFFQHVEMEVFIPEGKIIPATETIKELIGFFAGEQKELSDDLLKQIKKTGLEKEVSKFQGNYTHHYPLFFRYVLIDQTLISMTSGSQAYYAMGVFTYLPEDKRANYYKFCYLLSKILVSIYESRLHWGKYFPLKYKDISHLYPNLEKFKKIALKFDPDGVFQNEYAKEALGF